MSYYCKQCFDSNSLSNCHLEFCEARLKETGNARKSKMTREEANKKLQASGHTQYSYPFINALEVLGLLKFEEPKHHSIAHVLRYKSYGDIVIEEWLEGLVLWVGGKIVWKSWENVRKAPELQDVRPVTIDSYKYPAHKAIDALKKLGYIV